MRTLYKFQEDFGRNGELLGFFVADNREVSDFIGREIYFGEVLGKHSDVYVTLTKENLIPLTSDQEFIDKVIAYGLAPVGHNPLVLLEDD